MNVLFWHIKLYICRKEPQARNQETLIQAQALPLTSLDTGVDLDSKFLGCPISAVAEMFSSYQKWGGMILCHLSSQIFLPYSQLFSYLIHGLNKTKVT